MPLFLLQPALASLVSPPGIQSHRWIRAGGQQSIAYERAEAGAAAAVGGPPVLLLNGFGVGSFHWHRVMEPLARESGSVCYGMDYLGQGGSWPVDCADGEAPSEAGLRYAIDDWAEQTVAFLEEIVLADAPTAHGGGGCRLVGNSLGGLLAALIAARRPDLVEGIVLLNATPIWGSDLPGWDGRLPAPPLPRAVGRALFDLVRSPATITTMLSAVYAEPRTVGDQLPRSIRQVTDDTDGGHAAFASILWSPPAAIGGGGSFDDLLRQVRCPVLLLYGQEDPWITPAFGRTAYRALAARNGGGEGGGGGGDGGGGDGGEAAAVAAALPAQQLITLSPCGHCPQHEAPAATAAVVARWLRGDAALSGAGGEGESGGGSIGAGAGAGAGAGSEMFAEAFGMMRARRVGETELGLAPWEQLLTWALR